VLGQLDLGLRLGYVGVIGAAIDECDLKAYFRKYAIDDSFAFESNNPPGQCISVFYRKDRCRALKTTPGANNELTNKLSDSGKQSELCDYLANTRWIHLTSFVDREALALVVDTLKRAKSQNTHLKVSFDPGSEYCRNATGPVKEAIGLADYLFLNWREFCELAGYEEAQALSRRTDLTGMASNVFKHYECPGLLLVLKGYRSTLFFQSFQNSVFTRRFWQITFFPLPVRDDTGAGDVFAAGFIAAKLVPFLGFDTRHAISFASRLVGMKLRTVGCEAKSAYGDALRQTYREIGVRENINRIDFVKALFSRLGPFLLGVLASALGAALFFLFFR
jgi:sugar/nucleoside kinase (ribokinase family)